MQIGYVGLGAMGGALARNLSRNWKLLVCDLSAEAIARLEALGATGMSSGAELARRCDVIFLCLPRSSNVRQAIFGANGLLEGLSPGRIIVDQTSGEPSETEAMANELLGHGITLLDAPVAGGTMGADAGTITIMTSGPREAYEKIQPILDKVTVNAEYCGEKVGTGQALKALNNTMNFAQRLYTLEVIAMGLNAGLSLETMTDVVNAGSGVNRMSRVMMKMLAQGKPSADFLLDLMYKDVMLGTGMAAKANAPMLISDVARSMLQSAIATEGKYAQLDSVITMIGKMSGAPMVAPVSKP